MELITPEAIEIKNYIEHTWPSLQVQLEERLNEVFPDPPINMGLRHIWKFGSADIVIRRNGKVICIVEPGGSHHFNDEKQMRNDRRKWMLCTKNGVQCLRIGNNVFPNLSNRKKRNMLGKFLFT